MLDILGRRWGVAVGIMFIFLGTILQSIPRVDEGLFIGGRFLVGFGSNISQTSGPLLIMEVRVMEWSVSNRMLTPLTQLAHPQHRGKVTTMYNTLWYVGSIVAAWTVFGTIGYSGNAAWRVPVALQALMPLVQFIGLWFLPESPRWLCSKDRGEEALGVLVKVSAAPYVTTSGELTTTTVSCQRRP